MQGRDEADEESDDGADHDVREVGRRDPENKALPLNLKPRSGRGGEGRVGHDVREVVRGDPIALQA